MGKTKMKNKKNYKDFVFLVDREKYLCSDGVYIQNLEFFLYFLLEESSM